MMQVYCFENADKLFAFLQGIQALVSDEHDASTASGPSLSLVEAFLENTEVYIASRGSKFHVPLSPPLWEPDPKIDPLLRWAEVARLSKDRLQKLKKMSWPDVFLRITPRSWQAEASFSHLIVWLQGTRRDFIAARDQLLGLERYNPDFRLLVAPLDVRQPTREPNRPKWERKIVTLPGRAPSGASKTNQPFTCLMKLENLTSYGPILDWRSDRRFRLFYPYDSPLIRLYVEWGFELSRWNFVINHFRDHLEYILIGGKPAPNDPGQVYRTDQVSFTSLFQVCDIAIGSQDPAILTGRDPTVDDQETFQLTLTLEPARQIPQDISAETLRRRIEADRRRLMILEADERSQSRNPTLLFAFREEESLTWRPDELERLRNFVLEWPLAHLDQFLYLPIRLPNGESYHLVVPEDFDGDALIQDMYRPKLIFQRDRYWAQVGFDIFLPEGMEVSPRVIPMPEYDHQTDKLRKALGLSPHGPIRKGDVVLILEAPTSREAPEGQAPTEILKVYLPRDQFVSLSSAFDSLNARRVTEITSSKNEINARLENLLTPDSWDKDFGKLADEATDKLAEAWKREKRYFEEVIAQTGHTYKTAQRMQDMKQVVEDLADQRVSTWRGFLEETTQKAAAIELLLQDRGDEVVAELNGLRQQIADYSRRQTEAIIVQAVEAMEKQVQNDINKTLGDLERGLPQQIADLFYRRNEAIISRKVEAIEADLKGRPILPETEKRIAKRLERLAADIRNGALRD